MCTTSTVQAGHTGASFNRQHHNPSSNTVYTSYNITEIYLYLQSFGVTRDISAAPLAQFALQKFHFNILTTGSAS